MSGEINLDYQPLVSGAGLGVVAVQALLRWNHEEHGRLNHQQCLELLAETGLSLPIGRWMLGSACEQFCAWILSGISGRVVEVGAGNGMNFGHYPDTVTEVVAVEPEDQLRALAERAAADAPVPVPVRVVAGHAGALPVEDGAFDAVVASLVLCSVPDVSAALAEIRRVLRPGGESRFFEHVRSTNPLFGVLEDAISPLWSRMGGGCRLNRDTEASIRVAGFDVEQCERVVYAPPRFFPRHAHILGRATVPS